MNLSPIKLLREAIKAVPALKYALGVAGLVAVVAIVGAFRVSPAIAVMGSVITLVLMVALLIFAKLTKTAKKHFLLPAMVLMWSFLLLVIAAASLLFTSTFFGWPMKFSALPHREEIKTPLSPDTNALNQVNETVATAQRQLSTKDYEGAWKTLQEAAVQQPNSDVVLDAQVDVAMPWLRNLVVREPHTFTEIVDKVTPSFFKALTKAKGSRSADICAHIGWAQYLKSRENPDTTDIDANFRKAIELDPENPYGHAMLGFRLLQHSGHLAEAREHFEIAVGAKRDREWVRVMQLQGLQWTSEDANKLELARVANEVRKNGETFSAGTKANLFSTIYWFGAEFEYITNLVRSLPAAEHLATLNWLADKDGWSKAWPEHKFVLASLKEQTGDWAGALDLYRGLTEFNTYYQDTVKQSIARCELHVAGK